MRFCGHRWVENSPVIERAVEIWPNIVKFVEAVKTKKVKNPGISSFDTICTATVDPLIMAKFHFFVAVSASFTPFLTKYQTDRPMLPFLIKDPSDLLKSLMKRFVKKEHQETSAVRISQIKVTDKAIWASDNALNVGIGADLREMAPLVI